MENRLDCCVVRDLLPAYIERLTEPETSAQVQAHLEGCEKCRAVEAGMVAQVSVAAAGRRTLNFLKRVRRTRLIAAGVTLILMLWCIWWLYDMEYHYPNTEAGRLAAVEGYVAGPAWESQVSRGVPIHCAGWQEVGNKLLIFYKADTSNNIYGVLQLERGLNGKYAPVQASYNPSSLRLGLYGEMLEVDGQEFFWLGAYNCREVYSVQAEFAGVDLQSTWMRRGQLSLQLSETDFLRLMDREELVGQVDWEEGTQTEEIVRLYLKDVRLFDREDRDITLRYTNQNGSAEESWSSGKTSAERFLLYVYIGVAVVLGGVFIQYFLRRD